MLASASRFLGRRTLASFGGRSSPLTTTTTTLNTITTTTTTSSKQQLAWKSTSAAATTDDTSVTNDTNDTTGSSNATTTTTTASAFTGSKEKSGSPSPWAVFDAWGAGDDKMPAIDPDIVKLLDDAHVQIPMEHDNPQDDNQHQQQPVSNESDILQAYDHLLQGKSSCHFGYPYNLMFDYQELMPFLKYSINNLGDPFNESNYGVHSRQFEKAVITFFAQLWKIPKDHYWGYVTTSGTEGNLHGILLAREAFPNGILYTSQETHYSIFKAARYYRMQCNSIPTLPMGEIDYDLLAASIRQNNDKPVILNVNIGTTVKGAVDNLDRILRILKQEQIPRSQYYIHCDGALFAMMMVRTVWFSLLA